jgi:hypothetical protein
MFDTKAPRFLTTYLAQTTIGNQTILKEITSNSFNLANLTSPQSINLTILDQSNLVINNVTLTSHFSDSNFTVTKFAFNTSKNVIIPIFYNVSWGKFNVLLSDNNGNIFQGEIYFSAIRHFESIQKSTSTNQEMFTIEPLLLIGGISLIPTSILIIKRDSVTSLIKSKRNKD